jgi:hypothetical protein
MVNTRLTQQQLSDAVMRIALGKELKRPRGERGLFYLRRMEFRSPCFREPDWKKFA